MVQGYRAAKPFAPGQETAVYVADNTFCGGSLGRTRSGLQAWMGTINWQAITPPLDPESGLHPPLRTVAESIRHALKSNPLQIISLLTEVAAGFLIAFPVCR